MSFKPEDFPSLQKASTGRYLDAAIMTLSQAVDADQIRNADLVDIKSTLGNAVYRAWQKVTDVYFGRGKDTPKDVDDLFWKLSCSNVYELNAAKKRLDATKVTGPFVDSARAFVAEVYPIAAAMNRLTEKVDGKQPRIVMGRAPRLEPPPVNPNRLDRTCACCFRQIAVAGGLGTLKDGLAMGRPSHHGYRRPGTGWQTKSCDGVQFQPLETSPDGLDHVIGRLQAVLESDKGVLARKDRINRLPVEEWARGKRKMVWIEQDDPRWNDAFRVFIHGIERDIEHGTRVLAYYQRMRAEWVPKPIADVNDEVRELAEEGLLPSTDVRPMDMFAAAAAIDTHDEEEVERESAGPRG